MQVVPQRADVVDADLIADRLEHVNVRMRAALHPIGLADQLRREGDRGRALAHAGRAVKEVRVRGPFRQRGA